MKNMIQRVIVLLLFTSTVFIFAEQFIIKKGSARKKPSVARLKQECCEQFGSLLRELPLVLKKIADVQSLGVESVCAFFEDEKKGVFVNADKKQLQQVVETLSQLNDQMIRVENYLQKTTALLRSDMSKEKRVKTN